MWGNYPNRRRNFCRRLYVVIAVRKTVVAEERHVDAV